ncbi:SAM-dependent methyltransferase [Streptomyces boncukensis]|uniref:SAM-dependent methyltransferase n=1 Tax=Streptomyces boncukensis TaxID=2711219 RepID=A0A6G4X383_9ACTN|nr:SAM-dependent methyltransferase [Streptomyces boncukensis]NGO71592.1 SAM-dependent methyltransferase [Streptomyces boncukensis]
MTERPAHAYQPGSGVDITVPHSARVMNYWIGGKDHYRADQAAGDRVRAVFPGIVDLARTGRRFSGRCVRYLAAEAGIRQFLDIGTGLPAADNTHEVAQRVAPGSRVVYVDNDPLVLAYARALLTSTPSGATAYLHGDVHHPERILEGASRTLDLTRPVAVLLMGVLAHVGDYDEARGIVHRLTDALPSGSYLAIRDGTNTDPAYVAALDRYNRTGAAPYRLRSPAQLAGFLEGLETVGPGVVPCSQWRLDPPEGGAGRPARPAVYGGMGRKP